MTRESTGRRRIALLALAGLALIAAVAVLVGWPQQVYEWCYDALSYPPQALSAALQATHGHGHIPPVPTWDAWMRHVKARYIALQAPRYRSLGPVLLLELALVLVLPAVVLWRIAWFFVTRLGRVTPGQPHGSARWMSARLADWGAAWRRLHPTVPEQQMLGILASLGERDGVDFVREYKIAPSVYADVAFVGLGRVIEVFGGVHTHDFFSRSGERAADDERKLQLLTSLGWEVLVVKTAEMSQKRWASAVERVGRFLADGHGKWSPETSRRGGDDDAGE